MDGVAIGAALAGIGGIIGLFMNYIANRDKMQSKQDKALAVEKKEEAKAQAKRDAIFAAALDTNTKALELVAASSVIMVEEARLGRAAQEKGFGEAEKRNGHLAEIATENNKNNLQSNKEMALVLGKINDAAAANTISSDKILKSLEDSNILLVDNTKKTLAASEKVAAALLVAAEKVESTPLHIDEQTVARQTITRNVTA